MKNQNQTTDNNNKPIKTYTQNNVYLSIFKNEYSSKETNETIYPISISLKKMYLDKDNNKKYTSAFNKKDLSTIQTLIDKYETDYNKPTGGLKNDFYR